jgi:hypothetical protein
VADGDGWYRIAPSRTPQNYGYNGIELDVPDVGTEVGLEFEGMAGAEAYGGKNFGLAGWRYGFVAYLEDESRVYSEAWSGADGAAAFTVPDGTEYLWLVVMGVPTEHFPVVRRRRDGDGDEEPVEEAWPSKVRLSGTSIDEDFIR